MLMNNNEYLDLVQTIKQEIQQAQYKATLSVNKELIILYYNIGKIINEHKSWGNKFIENLAADIKLSFPNAKGYSVRNLKYMSKFASTYPDEQFVQTVSAQIPWSHNVAILDKVKGEKQREWYIRKTAENGWSHNVLIHQIESGLYERQAIADKISNFESRLASPQSELAVQTIAYNNLLHQLKILILLAILPLEHLQNLIFQKWRQRILILYFLHQPLNLLFRLHRHILNEDDIVL